MAHPIYLRRCTIATVLGLSACFPASQISRYFADRHVLGVDLDQQQGRNLLEGAASSCLRREATLAHLSALAVRIATEMDDKDPRQRCGA